MSHPVRSPRSTRPRVVVTTAGLIGLLLLSSCRIPDLCCADRGQTLPTNFNGVTTSDNSACVGFDEFFQDPILVSLIAEGLRGNQELKILWQEVQIANNEVLKRRGAIFPFVTLGTRASLDKPSRFTRNGAVESQLNVAPGKAFPDPLPNFLVAADLTWEVDIWRALRNARDAACLRYLATNDGRNYIVTRLVSEIAGNYYTLMALDKRLEILDATISLQEQSLEIAIAKKEAARGTELAVQRFQAEVRKNQSEKLIVKQEIIETENRINFLLGRYPQPVPRTDANYLNLNMHSLAVGVPAQLLRNRPDVVKAERQVAAAGLDVEVARAAFYPRLTLTGGVGFEAFNPRYLVRTPDSIVAGIAGDLLVPVINRSAIEADYRSANAMQLQEIYDYQRTLLNAFTEVVNSLTKVQNYSDSIAIKKEQLTSLEASVDNASRLFQNARAEYIEVLFAQRDLMEARLAILDTKKEQLVAIVDAYQALGGGLYQHSNYVETVLPTEPPGEPASDQAVPPLVPPQPPAAPDAPMPTPAAPAQDNPAPAPAPAMDE